MIGRKEQELIGTFDTSANKLREHLLEKDDYLGFGLFDNMMAALNAILDDLSKKAEAFTKEG